MLSSKTDYKIVSMKSQELGSLNVEILPVTSDNKEIKPGTIKIQDPKSELLNKNINFVVKINEIKGLSPAYEDIYCQFNIFNDTNVYKTETIKGDKGFKFSFNKKFTFTATAEVIFV